jgi:exodeoxyribonuclease V alpha subunit
MVYRVNNARNEARLAALIHRQLLSDCQYVYTDLDHEIDEEERILRIRFAPEQREAVKMALSHSLSIITGGPGTGKTMLAKAVAHHTTAAFIRVVGSEFVQKYLGEVSSE